MLLVYVLAVIGALVVFLMLLESLWSPIEMLSSFLMPYFLPSEDQPLSKRFGPWAAVTGCTDGIGKEYARELARRGLNIVLISRSSEKLHRVATLIEKEHSVKTKVVVADLSKGPEIYSHIEQELKDIPLGILVNNVGVQYEFPAPLGDIPSSKAWEVITVNCGAVTAISRLVLGGMAARGRGAIVNVSSGSELQPLPLMAVYAATKAYVRSLTLALREEYSSQNICVQHVSPMFVSTKINSFSQKLLEGNLLVPDAATYAKYAVSTLGRCSNTTGYWVHGIQYFFITLSPVWMRTKIGHIMNKQFRQEYMENNKLKSS